jgi:hypothetical protein
MRANQLRLWFASMAYVLLCALRRIGLHDTDFAKATCGTIRIKLLKIGATVRISGRRIKIAKLLEIRAHGQLVHCNFGAPSASPWLDFRTRTRLVCLE